MQQSSDAWAFWVTKKRFLGGHKGGGVAVEERDPFWSVASIPSGWPHTASRAG